MSLAFVIAAWLQDAPPPVGPLMAESPRLVAALETEQGGDSERVALFTDFTLVHSSSFRGRRVSTRRSLSGNELDVIRRVAAEVLALDAVEIRSGVAAEGARRIRVEVGEAAALPAEPGGPVPVREPRSAPAGRIFQFDELARVPLALARLRGAMVELQDRFYKEAGKEAEWNPSGVGVGTVLRRRGDGRRFRVVRDDTFERNLELEQLEGGTSRVYYARADLPKGFSDPQDESAPR